MKSYWEIEEGRIDSTAFFKLLLKYFPHATTFFAEGTSIEQDVRECYRSYAEEGAFLPGEQTAWPRSEKFRCEFTERLINELASLSERHAEPELLDHLFVYKDNEPLLEWHDAFDNVILISRSIHEEVVSGFAHELGLNYTEAAFD